jgi:hypothetical protein
MRGFLFSLAALAGLTLFAAPALAQDPWSDHRRYHDDLEHREFHRWLDHRDAHRYPMTWWEHERLHDALEHDRFHDRLEHREYHRQSPYYAPYPGGHPAPYPDSGYQSRGWSYYGR